MFAFVLSLEIHSSWQGNDRGFYEIDVNDFVACAHGCFVLKGSLIVESCIQKNPKNALPRLWVFNVKMSPSFSLSFTYNEFHQ